MSVRRPVENKRNDTDGPDIDRFPMTGFFKDLGLPLVLCSSDTRSQLTAM